MTQRASDTLSQRWGSSTSTRRPGNSRGRSNWGEREKLLEKIVSVDEKVVGRIIGSRGSNIRAMEQQISSREGGICRIQSVRSVTGATFLIKGSHARILEVAEQWLLKYQEQHKTEQQHIYQLQRYEQQEKEETEKLRLSKIAPDMNATNFPSISNKPSNPSQETPNNQPNNQPKKWGDCGSLKNAVQGLTLAQKKKRRDPPQKNWYPDSMVLLPLEKPVSFYDN